MPCLSDREEGRHGIFYRMTQIIFIAELTAALHKMLEIFCEVYGQRCCEF